MAKMNESIKKQWVAALRSGEYKQGQQELRGDEGFCCLGVLCDLHAKETGGSWVGNTYIETPTVLPAEVQSWAGVSTEEVGEVEIGGNRTYLAAHNDGFGVPSRTFAEIADAIESQL